MRLRRGPRGSVRAAVTVVTAAAFAVGGTGMWLLNGEKPEDRSFAEAERFAVRRGRLEIVLKRTGTFEAEQSVKVRAEVHGSARIVSLVSEGTEVKKDQVLMELDKTDIKKELEGRRDNLERTEANLRTAKADQEITQLDCDSKLSKARMDAELAESEVKKFKSGLVPKEQFQAQIKIEEAKVLKSRAEELYKRMPEMFKQGFVTKEEVEQNRLAVDTARNALRTAELERDILEKYTHPMRIKQLTANLTQARAEVERSQKVADRRRNQMTQLVTQRERELRRSQERMADTEERMRNLTLQAPSDGIVVYGGGYRWGWLKQREDVRVGGTVWRHQVVMRLPDLNTMQLAVNVHEADFNKVRVDDDHRQSAVITVDNKRGQTFRGYVKKIATLAHTERGREHVKLFSTTVGLDEQIEGMRPGMTANVEIHVDDLEDVLYVPVQAVHAHQGKVFCYVALPEGKYERREVAVGASNDSFAEITEGLEEGEEVLIVKPETEPGEAETPKVASPEGPGPRRRKRTR